MCVCLCLVIVNVNVTKYMSQKCEQYQICRHQMCSFKLQTLTMPFRSGFAHGGHWTPSYYSCAFVYAYERGQVQLQLIQIC